MTPGRPAPPDSRVAIPPAAPADAPDAPRATRLAALPRGVGRAAKGVGTAAGLVAAVSGAVFVLLPNLKPASENVVRIGNVAVEPDVTLRAYAGHAAVRGALDRAGGPAAFERVNCRALGRVGTAVHFDYEVKGYVDKVIAVRWSLVDGRTGRRLAESEGNDPLPLVFSARKRDGDIGSWETWVAAPPGHRGPLKVRLELYDTAERTRLVFADTPEFPPPAGPDGPPGDCP